jgi:hypothetical protein
MLILLLIVILFVIVIVAQIFCHRDTEDTETIKK